jgi:hypothetical protein
MPKFEFAYHTEEGYKVTFEAESRELAEAMLEKIDIGEAEVSELSKVEKEIVHGFQEILLYTLREVK